MTSAPPPIKYQWRINPDTCQLEVQNGKAPATFRGQDLRAQDWPPCPVCGTAVDVNAIDVRKFADRFAVFVLGSWECPNDCDPQPATKRTPR